MQDIMIVNETLGTSQDSIILSIGAVKFDINTGELGAIFYTNVDLQSSIDAGRSFSADTIKWWLRQGDAARKALVDKEGVTLIDALQSLTSFIQDTKNPVIWGNGSTLDISMLENAYDSKKLNVPWSFWNVNDVRTIARLAKFVDMDRPSLEKGITHNALDDAIHQAKYISDTQSFLVSK